MSMDAKRKTSQKVKIYSAYEPPPKVSKVYKDPSLARQSEADACNINKIIARFEKTGVLPVDGRELFFADVTQVGSFMDVQEHILLGTKYFMSLPAQTRLKFNNDPAEFLDFCSDEGNRDELVSMGLLETPEELEEAAAAAAADNPPAEPAEGGEG